MKRNDIKLHWIFFIFCANKKYSILGHLISNILLMKYLGNISRYMVPLPNYSLLKGKCQVQLSNDITPLSHPPHFKLCCYGDWGVWAFYGQLS